MPPKGGAEWYSLVGHLFLEEARGQAQGRRKIFNATAHIVGLLV